MLSTESYIIPTPTGVPARLPRSRYLELTKPGGISPYGYATLAAAALILEKITPEPQGLRQIVRAIHSDAEAEPMIAERRAIVALVEAGLVRRVGRTSQARYCLAPS